MLLNTVFGIDFGTTNSACVGLLEGRKYLRFADQTDGTPFPSLIIVDPLTGHVCTGRQAWNKRQEFSEHSIVVSSVKSCLGTDKTWNVAGEVWTPERMTSEVFREIRKQVSLSGGNLSLDEAVVAIPVGFTAEKRKALREAAELAGVKVRSFISESTAAFFRHYHQIGYYSKVAVLDWGGGTLDISLLENRNGLITELATGGLRLGGDDIDLKLARWAHDQAIRQKHLETAFEEMPATARDMMIARCERAKKDLSERDVVEIRLNKYGETGPFSVSLDIDTFSHLIEKEVSQVLDCFANTLKSAMVSQDELGCIVLVGGSVNLRPFAMRMDNSWNNEVIFPEESEWSVALGACMLNASPGSYRLAQDIGVLMADESLYPLAREGDTLSRHSVLHSFAVVEDSTTANFVFCDRDHSILGYLSVPTFGFFRETIGLQTWMDQDLIFRVKASSDHRSSNYTAEWAFPCPRFCYQLPAIAEEAVNE